MGSLLKEGWVPMTYGAVHFQHGVPDRVWAEKRDSLDEAELARQITEICGMQVRFGAWHRAESESQLETTVTVVPDDLPEVLRRLAIASAETYYDRFRTEMGAGDTDWDEESYAQDFDEALRICGLHWGEVDEGRWRDEYRRAMHEASKQLTRH